MKFIYCSQCNTKSTVIRKAIKNVGIIDVIHPHVCPEEPLPLDLPSTPIPTFVDRVDAEKTVSNINKLHPSTIGTEELRDRRFENEPVQKSSAPLNAVEALKSSMGAKPSRDMFDFDNIGAEKGE